ncbi:anthranilate phosphoribosyltransferase [Microbacter margulisiae]|uniref:Anthranilate phosphoribosyltransferase n=2 Tax=Microbacter margulisiae TaxID=1350067 RepID=A0A7W5DRH7_9PORP|nr:anthranilate phosphoribosyltransferase [Microbacter margulisiae]MBB3187750.1 anthranilate phosphoribosyltransferase [Microbacter margulisiae]
MKELLYRLFEHQYLDREEARMVLTNMAEGRYNDAQIAAFVTVYLMRSITVDELIGFREALLQMRVPVSLSEYNPIDIVGTGGDNHNTFNISTLSCFVVAGAGYKVAKHGNYGATSVSGASNVMEQHGVKFTRDNDLLRRSIEETNMAYLHAPFFNLALKTVAPVRKALQVRSFFNVLGPLVNPIQPKRNMLGVFNLKMARLYYYMYQQENVDFSIVHSLDGYDEISLTSDFKVIDKNGEKMYTPELLHFERVSQAALDGGKTPEDAARIFDNVLQNKATLAQKNVVVINAAFAIRTINPELSLEECIDQAKNSIESGAALNTLKKFIALNS